MNATLSLLEGTSKKTGKSYKAIKLVAGEYSCLLPATKIEVLYLQNYIKKKAHADFQADGDELPNTQGE